MFSFFDRKLSKPIEQEDVFDPDNPILNAIAISASIIEHRLDVSHHWVRQAREELKKGDLERSNGFLYLAREASEEAIALMTSADLLHGELHV